MTATTTKRTHTDTDPTSVRAGDLMALVYFTKVKSTNNKGKNLVLEDVFTGEEFDVEGEDLVSKSFSADRYTRTTKVTKTQMAELFSNAHNVPFTVNFDKQQKKGDIVGHAENRTLRGKLIRNEPLGRSLVLDLDQPRSGHRERRVDHRTIYWLILDGTKYEVKK